MNTKKINKQVIILAVLGLLGLVGLACLGGSSTTAPTEDTSVILRDDFSDPNSGWEVGDWQDGKVGYANGVYEVVSNGNSKAMWGTYRETFTDIEINVEATQTAGPSNNNNDYGVMCRTQENGDGYSLLISGDGFYAIQKSENGSFTALVDWTESSKIKKGNATNTIQAVCKGDSLTLYVNGSKLAETTDSTFGEGLVSLSATSYETDGTTLHFDNVVLRRP